MTAGIHVLGKLQGCPKELLEKVDVVKRLLQETVQEAKFNAVGETFHQFEPVGVTGVIVLAESHISIHTWPEKQTALVDVFTCGNEGNAEKGFEILAKKFQAEQIDKQVVNR